MFQIIFNEISAAEMSRLPTLTQLELLDQFRVSPDDLESLDKNPAFGKLERKDKLLYRFRAKDMRIYFQVTTEGLLVHRVLHKNTLQDFLYRSKLAAAEDEALSQSKVFWKLIEEGEKARRV